MDLAILDLMMPGMSGMEVLEEMRPAMGPPVIVVTAHRSVDMAVSHETRGIHYILKPFDVDEIPPDGQRALLTVTNRR